jgi:hypothetical protein
MAEFRGAVAELDAIESSLSALPAPIQERMTVVDQLSERTVALGALSTKFKKRTTENDPITGNPRYGPKMLEKVLAAIKRYEALHPLVEAAHAEVASIFGQAEQQRGEAEHQAAVEEQKRREVEKQQELEAELLVQQAAAELVREEEAKKKQQEQERQQLADRAAQSRAHRGQQQQQAEQAEAQAAAEADAAFQARLSAVQLGMGGLQAALVAVKASNSGEEHRQCVKALHILIGHICEKPEEPMFRQIKLQNPRFDQDIGQHAGGLECMVAMGFKLVVREEEEKVLTMEEPNLAEDMDKWSDWFDHLKLYRDCIQQEEGLLR